VVGARKTLTRQHALTGAIGMRNILRLDSVVLLPQRAVGSAGYGLWAHRDNARRQRADNIISIKNNRYGMARIFFSSHALETKRPSAAALAPGMWAEDARRVRQRHACGGGWTWVQRFPLTCLRRGVASSACAAAPRGGIGENLSRCLFIVSSSLRR